MPDRDNDPTDEEIARIKAWEITCQQDARDLLEMVKTCWWSADWLHSVCCGGTVRRRENSTVLWPESGMSV